MWVHNRLLWLSGQTLHLIPGAAHRCGLFESQQARIPLSKPSRMLSLLGFHRPVHLDSCFNGYAKPMNRLDVTIGIQLHHRPPTSSESSRNTFHRATDRDVISCTSRPQILNFSDSTFFLVKWHLFHLTFFFFSRTETNPH